MTEMQDLRGYIITCETIEETVKLVKLLIANEYEVFSMKDENKIFEYKKHKHLRIGDEVKSLTIRLTDSELTYYLKNSNLKVITYNELAVREFLHS